MKHRPLNASGVQIAFLVFVVVFMAAPAARYLGPYLAPADQFPQSLGRIFIFVPGIALLFLIPHVRRFCREQLCIPVPKAKRMEVALVAASQALTPFAIFGAIMLWYWASGGEMALARRIGQEQTAAAAMAAALSPDGYIKLALAVVVAPVVEELVFRGMLFRTWEAEWGWLKSMVATSIVFAAYHPIPLSAFVDSMILTAVYRRTGSLRACMLAHAVHNGLAWYPLLGQVIFRTAGKETGEIGLWPFHLTMLALLAVALPIYIWMARDKRRAVELPDEACVARS